MTRDFAELGEGFVSALSEVESERRLARAEAWLAQAIPVLQEAVADEIKDCVRHTMAVWDGRWDGFRQKMVRYAERKLTLEVRVNLRTQEDIERELCHRERAKKREAAQHGYDWDAGASPGRSPNDDRSDSMNPNNPAYQAAMDNRSNQLNPNNPAYDSSRRH